MSIPRHCNRLVLIAALALPLAAPAATRYTVTTVGVAGSSARDINLSGHVLGAYTDSSGTMHAFLNTGAMPLDLGSFGGDTIPSALNDSALVVGTSTNRAGQERAFSYANGSMRDLGTLGGTYSSGYAVNHRGDIVGSASTANPAEQDLERAFLMSGGVMRNIGTLPNGDMSRALDINNTGQITGLSSVSSDSGPEHPYHAFLYSGGVMTDLGTLGGLYSTGYAINDGGAVVGDAGSKEEFPSGHAIPHAFLYVNGVMSDLGTLGGKEAASTAFDINKLGQIVGEGSSDSVQRAFLYENGVLRDLNTLIDPASGWVLQDARAINDMQQIAATGCKGGQCYALRLDPTSAVPEPDTYAVLLLGLVMVGFAARRAAGVGANRTVSSGGRQGGAALPFAR
ncbi:DUF3466 family protein [Massilia sp. P8910]|uniref:PEP-CTERM sorting domain-containing protein n=1 Tax=Massilia antarctica TaxID=2765360 RepID=UPI001E4C292C|nr:PEP-CTERM sorting domain-containing protein [Massilia antarctica]MCE3605493.1 DUF3466 family protein [Massilia antarctica]